MRIVVLTADYRPIEGGIATVALQLSRELAALGHTVTVLAPFFAGQRALDNAEPFHVVRFWGYRLGWLRVVPMAAWALPLLRRADLAMAINVSHGGLILWALRWWIEAPYVTFGYAYEFLRFKADGVFGRLLRSIYNRARAVVAISTFTRDHMAEYGVAPQRLHTIFPGAPRPQPAPEAVVEAVKTRYGAGCPVLLSVGRLVPRKGHATVLRAMPQLIERYPGIVWVVAGQGPQREPLQALAEELGVSRHVVFAGRVYDAEIAALYQLCDVFVLPTGEDDGGQVEGFGLVFTEAQAYGKPVVAGRSGGTVDAVLHEETGLVVEPGDPDALAAAVLRLLDDPAYAQQLAGAAKARVHDELNWTEFTRRLMAVVEDAPAP